MKVAINKYFIESKHLTTEQKLQVIEDKIKEAQKEQELIDFSRLSERFKAGVEYGKVQGKKELLEKIIKEYGKEKERTHFGLKLLKLRDKFNDGDYIQISKVSLETTKTSKELDK